MEVVSQIFWLVAIRLRCTVYMKMTDSLNKLLLLEARARQLYYSSFPKIVKSEEFEFKTRTKRPPRDPINALISFGNVFLYNRIAADIWQSSLDVRIGIIHSTNRRSESLNLDLADIFKPIVVDKVIFTLINRGGINSKLHFSYEGEAVYLNGEGKTLFLQELEDKLRAQITVGDIQTSYEGLIRREINKIYRTVVYGEKYKPFKYQL